MCYLQCYLQHYYEDSRMNVFEERGNDEIRQAPPREPIHVQAKTCANQSLFDLQHLVHCKYTKDWPKCNQVNLSTHWVDSKSGSNPIRAQKKIKNGLGSAKMAVNMG